MSTFLGRKSAVGQTLVHAFTNLPGTRYTGTGNRLPGTGYLVLASTHSGTGVLVVVVPASTARGMLTNIDTGTGMHTIVPSTGYPGTRYRYNCMHTPGTRYRVPGTRGMHTRVQL